MSTPIDNLEVQIKSSSKDAISGIDALSSSLGKLKTATKGGLGLGSVSKQIQGLSSALSAMNSSSISNLEKIGTALKSLSGVGNIKISSTIATQINAIGSALSSLNVGDSSSKIKDLVTTLKPLEDLGKSNLGSMVTSLKKLPEVFESLKKMDMGSFSAKIKELAEALKPLADEMQKVANGFSAFPAKLQKLIQSTNSTATANKSLSKSYINLYAKFKMAYTGIKTIATSIGKFISLSNDYIENLNLFNASLGDFANEAQKYAETVGEIMGIDPGEWMRNQGVFMTLATGFGVASDRAYIMSKNLTQLGYDLSSFYNMSVNDAMLKLQSGIAGELEPLRRVGYDLSQARLQQEAYTLGINKKVSAMTQAEKAELRYYSILTQNTKVQGDMARTLNAPANQLRILKAQVTQAGRAIGNIFIPALNAILPYAIAVVKAIRLVAQTIAEFFGFELPEVDYSGINTAAGGAEDLSNALGDAGKNAKKLQQYTMGFDELNVINPNSGSGSGSDVGGGGGLGFELPEYDFLGELTESKANSIFESIKERLGEILSIVGLIGAGFLAWKISTALFTSIAALKTMLTTGALATPLTITLGAIISIVGFGIEFVGLKSAIEKGLDKINFAEIMSGAFFGTAGAALLGKAFTVWFGKICSTKMAFTLARWGMNLGVSTTGALGVAMGAAFGALIAGIPMFFVGIYDACKNGLDWLSGILIPAGATLTGAGIGAIIGMLGGPIGAGIGALIGLAVGALTDLVILIVENWGTIAEWFSTNVTQPIANFFIGLWEDVKGVWNKIAGFFTGLWEGIVRVWNTVVGWFDEHIIQPLLNFFSGLFLRLGQFAEGCWILIRAVWKVVSDWFNENVITPLATFFKGVWDKVSGFFTELWSDIKAIWKVVSDWFNENVITPVVTFFKGVWDKVSGYFANLWSGIKEIWVSVSTWFNENVIEPVKSVFDKCCKAISGFFSNLWLGIRQGVAKAMNGVIGAIENAINWVVRGINKLIGGFNDIVQWGADILGEDWGGVTLVKEVTFSRITVPTYEQGGFPQTGELFIAREAGAEMVGSIGRKTAVANNDQIVEGIAYGVSVANRESDALLREQNTLLRAMLEKESGVYLDGKKITKSVERHQKERGRVLVTGGAY